MIPYQKEKIINAIYFFSLNHKKRKRQYLYQTFLYKYLAFFDFRSLEETGEPSLGLTYKAMERGPVPDEIYNSTKYRDTNLYNFKQDNSDTFILPNQKAKPDYDYFSPYEIKLLNILIEIFADIFVTTQMAIDSSHEQILAWRTTWKNNPNQIIKYIDNFPSNILKKPPEKLKPTEEHFLIFSTIHKFA